MSQQSDLYRDLFEPGWREREQAQHDNLMKALSGGPLVRHQAIPLEGGGSVVVSTQLNEPKGAAS